MGKGCRLVLRTFAKLNLCLDILYKRSDGFHEIDSLFQNISLYDEMEIVLKAGDGNVNISSNVNIEDNILYKVWKVIGCKDKDVYIKLEKNIPIGGGLGGGSSNAAGFIVALSKAGIISREEIPEIAQSVGSDVPFFIYGGTAIVRGRGEIVTPLPPLTNWYDFKVKLYFPDFPISTKEAYSKLKLEWFGKAPMSSLELYEAYKEGNIVKIGKGTYNVFEYIIPKKLFNEIQNLRTKYPAALTGSGSTYFALRNDGEYHFIDKGVEIYAFEEA
ncbi:MAG: 4-(cytidine 5'-diphospho)-2-C-methyl-D-erythritol kinase [Fervidobacterium sp.]